MQQPNSNQIEILKENTMKSSISDNAEKKFKEEMKKDKTNAGEKIDKSKLEAEGACEIIAGKDEEKVCATKT
jgi:hypothetical protein